MMKLKADVAAKITRGQIVSGDPGRQAAGISTDTRTLKPGQGFVALSGERFDGAKFAATAVKNGAAWVMVEAGAKDKLPAQATVISVDDTLVALGAIAAHHRRQHQVKVAAVTGSLGKSTTKEMIAAVLAAKGRTLKNKGNFNNRVGLPLTLFRLNKSHRFAALEMGCNEPGEIGALARIADPDVGLITRVAPAHLEGLGSIDGVAKAKAEIIKELGPDKTFVLNLDDPRIVKRAKNFKGRVIGFTANDAPFKGERLTLSNLEKNVVAGRPSISFKVALSQGGKKKGRAVDFRLATLGRHNAANALAAAAVGRAFGVPLAEAAERVRNVRLLAGRGEVLRSRGGALVVNDAYNASPESVAGALETVAWWKGPMRGVAVLGEMMELGDYADEYHRRVGQKVAQEGMDLLVARGPRARLMTRAAIKAGLPKDAALVAKDNDEAAGFLKNYLHRGDWVLVKGSRAMGMESVARAIMR